jgi:D-amino peptidase
VKVYISMDMEGVAGVTHWEQTNRDGGPDYERFRRLMTAEASAAVAGAFDGGAAAVVVNDSHGRMRNLYPEELDPRARLIQGSPKPWSMVEGLDGSFGAALFCGYHAPGSWAGVLSHTYTGFVHRVRVGGREVGEAGLNGLFAGSWGVPVALVTGDDRACADARALFPGVITVETKRAITRYSAESLAPGEACRRIRAAAAEAVRAAAAGRCAPVRAEGPVRIEVEFADAGQADAAALMPGSERVDGVTLAYLAPDFPTALRAMRTWLSLAR